MSKPRLYLDEDVRSLLAEVLRQRGYDVLHVIEANMESKSDPEQLVYAINHQRAILTHNIKHYVQMAKEYTLKGKKHYGIIVSDQVEFKELLKRTLKCLYAYS